MIYEKPRITLADASEEIASSMNAQRITWKNLLTAANHPRTRRLREQAWLVMIILQDCGMRPDEVFPMRIENVDWDIKRIWIPQGKTEKARKRFVAISERVESLLRPWCGDRKEGRVFPSSRSSSGHLTTIAKGFQAARSRAGLNKKLVPIPLGTPMARTDGEESQCIRRREVYGTCRSEIHGALSAPGA